MSRKIKRTKQEHQIKTRVMYLYGAINSLHRARAYCDLHKCYLEGRHITYKKCNVKRCPHLKDLNKRKEVEDYVYRKKDRTI